MIDRIPVYHAHDVLEGMDPDIVEIFWDSVEASYGDAEYTLIKGKEAYRLIDAAAKEVSDRRGVSVTFTTPRDLTNEGIYFALPG